MRNEWLSDADGHSQSSHHPTIASTSPRRKLRLGGRRAMVEI